MDILIRFLLSFLILFYVIRLISYGIYTFKKKNINGGISIIVLSLGAFTEIIFIMADIFK